MKRWRELRGDIGVLDFEKTDSLKFYREAICIPQPETQFLRHKPPKQTPATHPSLTFHRGPVVDVGKCT